MYNGFWADLAAPSFEAQQGQPLHFFSCQLLGISPIESRDPQSATYLTGRMVMA